MSERRAMHTKFWFKNMKVKDHSEDLGEDGKIILKCMMGKHGWNV
jgi:hypothetical protein